MHAFSRLLRTLALVVCAVLGTIFLVLSAPGYFSDAREMDAAHAETARLQMDALRQQQGSLPRLMRQQIYGWAHGDLGQSRQYGTPVSNLLRERCRFSARLLPLSVALGWCSSLLLAIPLSMRRSSALDLFLAGLTALLLAVPVGLLAVLSLLSSVGGPVAVLATIVAVRDLKLLYRTAQAAWFAPHILHAHAAGWSSIRIATVHLSATLRHQIFAMAVTSFTLALSALVPVEVVFDLPGLGQLAWGAAMNRDLPVLIAVTALMAACVGLAGWFLDSEQQRGHTACA